LVNAGGDLNVCNGHDSTPLHRAAYEGHVEVARSLISAGANTSSLDDYGDTPLHDAARHKHGAGIARLLLDAGCKVDVESGDEEQPLHIAARVNADETIRCLLAFGADANAASGSYGTPLRMALEYHGERRTLAVLLKAGANIDMEELSLLPRDRKLSDGWRYLEKVNAAGGYENLVRTYRRVLTAPRGCLTRYLRQRFGRDAPHDVAVHVLEYWKPPGGP
jgi:ankyrin repeat protein